MALNAANGARESRQTIFFPQEKPLWNGCAPELDDDGLVEPDDANSRQTAPDSSVEASTSQPARAQDENVGQAEPVSAVDRMDGICDVSQVRDGAVFCAEETITGNLVMAELLSQSAAGSPEQLELFYLEAEAAARLHHPQIVIAYPTQPFAITNQRPAYLSPETETLRELLMHGGWFEPARAVHIIAQVADALAYAHETGVLHLNLQPEHIWLDSDDRVLITGFGIADDKQWEWARRQRAGRCAPLYLSPEQFGGQAGDRASDLYALGVIFYEMLTDRVPFDSNDPAQLRRWHKIKAPRPPYDFNHNLPLDLSEIVMAMLNRDPEVRICLFDVASKLKSLPYGIESLKDDRLALAPRQTNPMPLSELAAEVYTSSTPLVLCPVDEPRALLPTPTLPLISPQPRSQYHYQAILTLIILIMLPWIVISAIQMPKSGQNTRSPQVSQANPSPGATVDLAQTAGQSNTGTATQFASAGRANASGNPVADEQGDSTTSNDILVAPSAMPRTTNRSLPSSLPTNDVSKATGFAFGNPVRRIAPIYPASARAGVVTVEGFVDEKGNVTRARAISGPEMFRPSAVAAAQLWKFNPTTLNGVPVKVNRIITFQYDRAQEQVIKQPRERTGRQSRALARQAQGEQRKTGNKFLRPMRSVLREFKK